MDWCYPASFRSNIAYIYTNRFVQENTNSNDYFYVYNTASDREHKKSLTYRLVQVLRNTGSSSRP